MKIETNSTSMVKFNNLNWVMWKSMMEDFLTIKDLSNTLEGEEAKPKDIFYLEWNKMNKKTIAYIRQLIDISSCHYVANETNVYNLLKKLESVFEQKTVGNKIFLLRKLVNMKLKKWIVMTDHLNAFQSIVNLLVAMKMTLDDEMQTSLLLCSLLDSWETFVVTISNSIPNGALSMKLMKGNLFNK